MFCDSPNCQIKVLTTFSRYTLMNYSYYSSKASQIFQLLLSVHYILLVSIKLLYYNVMLLSCSLFSALQIQHVPHNTTLSSAYCACTYLESALHCSAAGHTLRSQYMHQYLHNCTCTSMKNIFQKCRGM